MKAIEIRTNDLVYAFYSLRRLIETIQDRTLRNANYYFLFSFMDNHLVIRTPRSAGAVLSIYIPYLSESQNREPLHLHVGKQICFMTYSVSKIEKIKLSFIKEEKELIMEYGTGVFRMKCQELPLDDVMIEPQLRGDIHTAKINPETFRKGVRCASGLCSIQNFQCGKITEYVHMNLHNGEAKFIGSNGKGLVSYSEYVDEPDKSQTISCNIHAKYRDILNKLMDYGLDAISTDGTGILFSSDRYRLSIPTSVTPYPNYKRIFPSSDDNATKVSVSRENLNHAVSLVNSIGVNAVISIKLTEREIILTGKDMKNITSSSETIPYINSDGPFVVSVNGSLLAETLKKIKDEVMVISYFRDKNFVTIAGLSDVNVLYLLLPIAVQ